MSSIGAFTTVSSDFSVGGAGKESTCFDMQTATGARAALATSMINKGGFVLGRDPFSTQLTSMFKGGGASHMKSAMEGSSALDASVRPGTLCYTA